MRRFPDPIRRIAGREGAGPGVLVRRLLTARAAWNRSRARSWRGSPVAVLTDLRSHRRYTTPATSVERSLSLMLRLLLKLSTLAARSWTLSWCLYRLRGIRLIGPPSVPTLNCRARTHAAAALSSAA